ncbi:hypothetical protein J4463_04585 [Candidatus Pacearchaeota archaeon]|nr:hypothetical protein [Candidatus Pacearchaeota archaeon]
MEKRGKKLGNLIKNNLLSILVIFIIISSVVVLAGNIVMQDSDFTISGLSNPTLNIQDTNEGNSRFINYGSRLSIEQTALSGANSFIDLSPYTGDSVSQSLIRAWRDVNTTGMKAMTFYRGDGTGSSDARIGVNGTTSYLAITGNLGVGTSSPTQKLDVDGNITADDFITKSLFFNGDALSRIKSISADSVGANNWQKVNHESLGDAGIIYQYEVEILDKDGNVASTEIRTFEGQSIDRTVALLLRANQQLMDELCKKDSSYSWC